jgi:UDP-3-O-[3-hydroxymyristoyl] glucosamine N-acyltransferase
MRGSSGFPLREVAGWIDARIQGDPDRPVRGVATIDNAGPDELSFLTNARYRKRALASAAGVLLVRDPKPFGGRDLLIHEKPEAAIRVLLEKFHPEPVVATGCDPAAVIDPSVQLGDSVHVGPHAVLERDVELGDGVVIGAGCWIGEGSRIGAGSRLYPNVSIYPDVRIGERCRLHAGVVIGADGFGYSTEQGVHRKIPQVGGVILEDDVEVGANSSIDTGAIDPTTIGRGTKIDDQVMIAHGVRIGEDCLLVAQSGIAGSTRIGDRVTLAGQSGIAGHLEIAAGTIVAAKSAVFQDVPEGAYLAGVPAIDHRRWKRSQAGIGRLDGMRKQLRELEQRLRCLEQEDKHGGHES